MGEKILKVSAGIAVFLTIFIAVFSVYTTIPHLTVVDEKTKTVEAVITDASRHGGNTTFMYTGKVLVPVRHREWYTITVLYNDEEYEVKSYNEDSYDEYKTKIGETVSAELVTKEHKDGSVTTEITSITLKES